MRESIIAPCIDITSTYKTYYANTTYNVHTRAVDDALQAAHDAIFFNMGQVCTAGSRLFVHEDIYDEFVRKAVEKAKARKIGNPFDTSSLNGPQVGLDLLICTVIYMYT